MGSRSHARARAGVCLAHLLTEMTKSLRTAASAARHLSQVASLLSASEGVGGRAFLSDERARSELASGQGRE